MVQGVKLMLGTSMLQKIHQTVEPYLSVQSVGPIPIGIIIGIAGGCLTLILLENKKFPAGLIVVVAGLALGLVLGNRRSLDEMHIGINLPVFLPFGWPGRADFAFALFALVLPQIPMTVGNAVVAYTDLSKTYFKAESGKVTYRAVCIGMALANFLSATFGGMPLCHGAGGLAAHYRFGARTAGSNIMIGGVFIVLAILFGSHSLAFINLLPLAVLGILLLFAGSQLCLTILDLTKRKDMFVCLVVLGITLATNLAAGFMAGIAVAYLIKSDRFSV
jgi:SulP family sulfate permease